eukprot:CAMPEP_0174376588 /NCGR_PEP_ID=MMETSP0811_2-20130205/118652_1 /TAXON_ID=73025 ORGANISM="Eutreptiella gymnastica-like, Strain CCMP1594" /NCGR_SAMPLE_ID=MMETSP0811_2 /ASSEMBLY_ACC=CAM_ASM_000667 /LENGTH=62 /DNA_ID=CAMNT_0015527883 /DNA_START=203 /DNA_END=391 /DNA_ORIENTATION=-
MSPLLLSNPCLHAAGPAKLWGNMANLTVPAHPSEMMKEHMAHMKTCTSQGRSTHTMSEKRVP